MAVTAGIDLMRGRPTPAIGTTEAKLQQRKLDALRRGVHRVTDADSLPYGVHVIGLGGAGVQVVERLLQGAPDDLLAVAGSRLSALAIDIGDGSAEALSRLPALASRFPADSVQVDALALPWPTPDALTNTLDHYRSYLELEYPMLQGGVGFQSWLADAPALPASGEPMPRAVAKAVYGQAYYEGDRPMAAALKRFAASTNATRGDAVVCIVFGLGGGTGSGMAIDLARHLSTGIFGRRVLVMGIGIAPCDGDAAAHRGGQIFPVLGELDALCDETQNRGVVQACGELYKNPFTAGFLLVPQQPTFAQKNNLPATHAAVDAQIAALLTCRRGANLWEVLRLLNWVAAPSTQHSAARTPWGAKWMHVLGFDEAGRAPEPAAHDLVQGFGVLPGYIPEFIELRMGAIDAVSAAWAAALDKAFGPEAPTSVAVGGEAGSVQFVLPRVGKAELGMFYDARTAYDRLTPAQRVLSHSMLLERGVVLCEPSTRIEGMAGAGLADGSGWVAIPYEAMRGPVTRPDAVLADISTEETRHAA